MKFRIIATLLSLTVLFILFLLFAGGSDSTPTEEVAPISLDGF